MKFQKGLESDFSRNAETAPNLECCLALAGPHQNKGFQKYRIPFGGGASYTRDCAIFGRRGRHVEKERLLFVNNRENTT